MRIASIISERRSALHQRWLESVVAGYSGHAARFFKRERNPFANPVGQTLEQETRVLLDVLLAGEGLDAAHGPLERILKVRAVQDFSPAEVLAFVFLLKPVIREALEEQWGAPEVVDDYLALCTQIDELALLAFNMLAQVRERIHEIRVNEVKRRVSSILRRSPLWDGADACVPYQDDGPRAGPPSGDVPGNSESPPGGDK